MEERPFVHNGKTLLSGIDPVRRAERTAGAVAVRDRTLYFCPSPLYGYGLARLLERLEKESPDSAILCIEADPRLFELSEKSIIPSLSAGNKLRITNIREKFELCSFVRNTWGGRTFRRVEVIRFSGGWQLFPDLYDSLCEALRSEIATDWSNAMTLTRLGRLYIRNAMRNLSLIPFFSSIENVTYEEKPVLVLGAGPSLDETLDALVRRFSSRLYDENRPFKIVCVDTCLGALRDRGIAADIAVILESQYWNLRDFIGCNGWNINTAIDLSAHPGSARILAGKGYLFFTPWTDLRIFDRLKKAELLPAVIPPLGSVGLSAMELCRRLTKGKIICAGLDFSFTFDKYHARGAPGHRGRLSTQTRLRGLFSAAYGEGVFASVSKSGLSVCTNPAMTNYCNLFQREFGSDSRVFDIEGPGLPLGVKTISMDEAMDMLNSEKSGINRKAAHDMGKQNDDFDKKEKILNKKLLMFLEGERNMLLELKKILTGEGEAGQERLSFLINECDYLWAHFPDYAGKDRQRNELGDISFLKRVRTEIEPMLKLIERGCCGLLR